MSTQITVEDFTLEAQRIIEIAQNYESKILADLQAAKDAIASNYYNLTVDQDATASATVFNSLKAAAQSLPYGAFGKITLNNDELLDKNIDFKGFKGEITGVSKDINLTSELTTHGLSIQGQTQPAYIIRFEGELSNLTVSTCNYDKSDSSIVGRHSLFRHGYINKVHLESVNLNLSTQKFIENSGLECGISTSKYGSGVEITLDDNETDHCLVDFDGTGYLSILNVITSGFSVESLVEGVELDVNSLPINIITNLKNWD